MRLVLRDKRHSGPLPPPTHQPSQKESQVDVQDRDWRMRERLKTVSVALVVCLNIGIDPPDVVRPPDAARLECWVDPMALPPQKALETIGRNLQQQYEVWQPRAKYESPLIF